MKDQVDVLREQFHQYSRYGVELGDIRTRINELETTREDMMGDILRQQQLHSFSVTSNESVEFITTNNVAQPISDSLDTLTITNVSQAVNESLDTLNVTNVSQANNQLDETLVLPTRVPLVSLGGSEQPGLETSLLVGQPEAQAEPDVDSVQLDEKETSEESQGTEATTHPLTERTLEDRDSLDGDTFSQDERIKNIEDWNFSSVQTVDDKSIDEVTSYQHFFKALTICFVVGSSKTIN